MSEKAKEKEEGGKKKGKMPIILVLLLVIGGGGFFMMKGKGKKAEPPKPALAEKLVEVPELLVNLKGASSYCRLSLALQLDKNFHGNVEEAKFLIRDAIIQVLSSKSVSQMSDKDALKEEIAFAINRSLHAVEEKEPKAEESSDKKSKKGEKADEAHAEAESELVPRAEREHKDWDSDEGPVLKVYFSDFVTQ